MTAHVIDGRKLARRLKEEVAQELADLRGAGTHCGLATVVVGDDYSSLAYERRLRRIATELDVDYRGHHLPAATSQGDLIRLITELNDDPRASGILILRPLPAQVSEAAVFRALSPVKDIESVHPENAGLLALGTPRYVPSTAGSVFHLLDSWLDEAGEDRADFYHRSLIVVVGRSNNVGKPAVSLAYDRQAAVESVDAWSSRALGLGRHTRRADVLIVAAGQAGLIRAEHIHQGAIVIDVGINPVADRDSGQVHMVGDTVFDQLVQRARAVTPVPGGVGPVTDVWLIRNTVTAAQLANTAREAVSGER